MRLKVYRNLNELYTALAEHFTTLALECISARGQFNVVLAGGNSPNGFYRMLTSDKFRNEVPWQKVNFFLGDERYVPLDSGESNARMIKESLLEPLGVDPSHVFFVDTSLSPGEAARHYSNSIMEFFGDKPVSFDWILLGLGENSHTASLFPGSAVLHEQAVTVVADFVKEVNSYRITMTAPLINQARHIVFLVHGKNKAHAVSTVLDGEPDFEKYPAQLVYPVNGTLMWYLDKEAAQNLPAELL